MTVSWHSNIDNPPIFSVESAQSIFQPKGLLFLESSLFGFGTSLQLHNDGHFLGCVSLATSIDGGIFLNLAFDPVVDIEPRVKER